MTATVTEIKDYKIYMTSHAPKSTVHMTLFDTADNYCAHIAFLHEEWDLPEPREWESGVYAFYYHRREYMDVVDLLRNENPVYLWWHDSTPPNATLLTSEEPVGENEEEQS